MCNRWCIAIALLLVGAPCAFGQGLRPCPAEVQKSANVERLCRESLPANGHITLYDGAGGFCLCTCRDLLGLPYGEVVARRAARDSTNTANFHSYLYNLASSNPCTATPTARGIVNETGALEWNAPDTCEFDLEVVGVIRAILISGVIEFDVGDESSGGFQFILEQQDREVAFPYICATLNDGVLSGRIHIPRRMLRDEAVGVELIRFMLLHELAHGALIGGSEFKADSMASSDWLPRLVGEVQVDAERGRVAKQLWDYSRSQFHREDFTKATPCSAAMNCYPSLNCRINAIRDPNTITAGPTTQGYPVGCWNDHVGSTGHRPSASYDHRQCRRFVRDCERFPDVCVLEEQLEGIRSDLEFVFDPCTARPELCDFKGKDVEPVLRSRVRRLDPRQRKLLRTIRTAERQAQGLRDDIMIGK